MVSMRILLLMVLVLGGRAWATEVENLRTWPAPDTTRVVLDISGPVEYRLFRMSKPERVVIDIRGARATGDLGRPLGDVRLLQRVRYARRGEDDLRVVLDLERAVQEVRDLQLPPNREHGHRLVIDLVEPAPAAAAPPASAKAAARVATQRLEASREIVVAVDPGHGGEDPGAIGRRGTREKDIVLAVSRRLVRLINAERGMRAFLVRDGDYYVGLRQRMQRARAGKADLFVSIHADAFRDARVRGSSVYVLSQNGASSEAARWLAERENASDFIGGVTLEDKDELLRSVLLDLSQTAALEASIEVGARMLDQLARLGKVHKRRVQHAGFAVLKSPDIPSVLVETAFISNPAEEQRLRQVAHQERLATALTRGIRGYFQENPPPGTLLAGRTHRVDEGDTLSEIARQYQVSTSSLRVANELPGDTIRVGQTLAIP